MNLIASGNRKRFLPPIDADTPGDFCFFSAEIFCDVIAGNLDLTLNGGSGQKGQSGGRGSKGRDNGLGVREPFVIYLLLSSVNSLKSMEILGKYPDFFLFFPNSVLFTKKSFGYCTIKASNN